MIKFLLLLALVALIVGFLRQSRASRTAARRPPAQRAPEAMVKCAYCGVNQPQSECVVAHGDYYCSDAHRQQAEARK